MKTLLEVLNSGADYLARQNCPESRAVMQRLMSHVLHCDRTYLYTHFDRLLSEDELAPLRLLLKRKAEGEPLQHLIGSTEFYRREFTTDARALIPRPETEELVELILKRADSLPERPRILDMGTGSGIIGITLALELADKNPEATLADISPAALTLALENAVNLGAKVSTVETDLFSAFSEKREQQTEEKTDDLRFDIIAANLPYIPDGEQLQQEVNFDPSSALYGGRLGWEIIERFLKDAPAFLTENGFVALETGHDQSAPLREILEREGYRNISILDDISGVPRFPFATRPEPTDSPAE